MEGVTFLILRKTLTGTLFLLAVDADIWYSDLPSDCLTFAPRKTCLSKQQPLAS